VWGGFGTPVRVPATAARSRRWWDRFLDAGFVLERLLEPRPIPPFEEQEPADYKKLMRQPGFICFRARKPAG